MAKQQVQLLQQQVVILVLNIHIPSMLQSEIGDLKQGFSVSVEVKNKTKAILVPLTSIVTEMIRTMSGCLTSRKRPRKWKLVWVMLMQTTKKSLQV